MLAHHRGLVVATALALSSVSLGAQSPGTGHWEGSIKVPDRPVAIVVDLARTEKGELTATFGNPAEEIKAFPLSNVVVAGRAIRFTLKAGAGGGTFEGTLADDGKSITGNFNTAEGGHSIPFTLTRTGDAVIEVATKSPAIAKELEGKWNGTIDANGRSMRLVLTMANRPDGTSAASILSVDGGGVEIPVDLMPQGTSVTLNVKMIGATYAATLNAAGTELAGTWTQGSFVAPVTFKQQPR